MSYVTYLDAIPRPPLEIEFVSEHSGGDSTAIVASPADQHTANARNFTVGLESESLSERFDAQSPSNLFHASGLVVVCGQQNLFAVVELHLGAVDNER